MRRGHQGGTLVGVALGLVVGVLISFGVVWYLNKTPLPFVDKVGKPEVKAGIGKDGQPVALPGKPGDKPVDKPAEPKKFDFYDILEGKKPATPGGAVPHAGHSIPPAPTSAAAPPKPAEPAAAAAPMPAAASAGSLYLQVGAFQKPADAENLKGRLAMMGFEAGVTPVEVPDKGTLHRVRTGPYASSDQMNQARTQLSQNGIQATVIRIKD